MRVRVTLKWVIPWMRRCPPDWLSSLDLDSCFKRFNLKEQFVTLGNACIGFFCLKYYRLEDKRHFHICPVSMELKLGDE